LNTTKNKVILALLILVISTGIVTAVLGIASKTENKPAPPSPESSIQNARAVGPRVVGSSTTFSATVTSAERKTFYACGLFWAFYDNGSGLAYATSPDGSTWTTSGTPIGYDAGDDYSLYFDGTYAHFVDTDYTPDNDVSYARALPCSNGSLLWGPMNQVVQSGVPITLWYDLSVTVDSSGRPWILYDDHMCFQGVYVTRSSSTNGTWTTDSGFPHLLMNPEQGEESGFLVPLPNNQVYMEWDANGPLNGVLYNGTAFGPTENITEYRVNAGVYVSAVAQGENVDLAFLNGNGSNDILFTQRNLTGWTTPMLIQPGNSNPDYSDSTPVLSVDQTNGNLYCFWAGNPTPQRVYYKKRIDGNWDPNPTNLATEQNITYYRTLTGFYQKSTYIGLEYTVNTDNTTTPYLVKYALLNNTLDLNIKIQDTNHNPIPNATVHTNTQTETTNNQGWANFTGYTVNTTAKINITIQTTTPKTTLTINMTTDQTINITYNNTNNTITTQTPNQNPTDEHSPQP
jgi:hypothetical protein